MNKPLTLRKVGNSRCPTVSDIARDLGLGEGDMVHAVRTPRGFGIAPYDADFEKAVESAHRFMGKYPSAMNTLVEQASSTIGLTKDMVPAFHRQSLACFGDQSLIVTTFSFRA